jgi:CubicO group peptidase (beta-lactamase class C family)
MATFEDKIDTVTADEKKGLLGIVLLGVDAEGKTIYNYASGRTSLNTANSKPISNDSILRLASCTKIMTSIAALRLVQEGKLSLDDPKLIEEHLPELWKQDVITSAPGQPLTYTKREKDVTLRQLLTHSSGVGYDLIDPRLQAYRKERKEPPKTLIGPVIDAFGVPLLYQPGQGWAYGGSLDWTGLLVERVSGMKLGEFLRQEVFDIVGCDAGIGFFKEVDPNDCVMTVTRGGEGLKEWKVAPQRFELGGGALLSSTANFTKVLADIISPEPKILEPKTLDILFSPQFEEGTPSLAMLRASAPVMASMTGALTSSLPPTSFNHALGGMLITENNPEVGKTKGTMAWGGAFNCVWFANREQGIAGFYGTSLFPPADPISGEFVGGFIKEIWARKEEKVAN